MTNVLVTGATGLVGSHLCKELVDKGYKVRAFVRTNSDKTFLNTLGVEYAYGDIRFLDDVNKAMEGIDTVFHCAGQVDILKTFDTEHASINILGTKNALKCAVSNKIKKFIYVSTLGVLGILKEHYYDREDSPYIKVGHPYFDTKIDAERLVINYYNDKNLPVVILRPGLIYGEKDRNLLPNLIPYLLKSQIITYVGRGNNDIALTSIKNLVNAIILAEKNDEAIGQIYNITDDQGITLKRFVEEICHLLKLSKPIFNVSVPIATTAGKTMQTVGNFSNKDFIVNEHMIAMLNNNFSYDITKAKKELGYAPQHDFKEDIRDAVDWYLTNHQEDVKKAKLYLKKTRIKLSVGSALTVTAAIFAIVALLRKKD